VCLTTGKEMRLNTYYTCHARQKSFFLYFHESAWVHSSKLIFLLQRTHFHQTWKTIKLTAVSLRLHIIFWYDVVESIDAKLGGD